MVVVIGKSIAAQKVLKELAGSSYKRQTLDILVLAGCFADNHERSLSASPVYNDIGSAVSQAAVPAVLAFAFKRFPLHLKIVCHINLT
jgi:hypothetical protein